MDEQKDFFIGPVYLHIEAAFDTLDLYDNSIERPDCWNDKGQTIVWGYRISGSGVTFQTRVDYLPPDAIEYIQLCQYVCDRMADLLEDCLRKINHHNEKIGEDGIDPSDLELRLYYSCDYLSLEEGLTLSLKLRDFSKNGRLKQRNQDGGLADKVSQFKEIDFCWGSDSRSLKTYLDQEKKRLVREISLHNLKTYQDYLSYQKQRICNYNRLDMLNL